MDAAIHEVAREFDISTERVQRLRQLRDFEIVVVCDDSGSMKTPVDNSQRTRWDELCKIVKIVIKIGVIFDCTGVDIYFLNRKSYSNVKDPKEVDEAFQEPPSGYTPLVPILNRIFLSKLADRGRDKKLLVFVATDGMPTDDNGNDDGYEFRKTMIEKRQIDTTYVSFLLCTDDPIRVNRFMVWDKQMNNVDVTDDFHTERNRIRKCQKNSYYPFSYGDYVIKALVGAIDPEIDALNEEDEV